QLVDDRVAQLDAAPVVVAPGKGHSVDERARRVHPVGLPPRPRVGPGGAAVEGEGVAPVAGGRAQLPPAPVDLRPGLDAGVLDPDVQVDPLGVRGPDAVGVGGGSHRGPSWRSRARTSRATGSRSKTSRASTPSSPTWWSRPVSASVHTSGGSGTRVS